ncbi:MAG: hypothetical protein KAT35_03105 [Candidatus Aenigmarchaeota archaeon]|nr:hypothetical protein [Candidatus Aenigmarchaeota archaeon]
MTSYRAKFSEERRGRAVRLIDDVAIKGTVFPRKGPIIVDGQYTLYFNSDLELEEIRRKLYKIDLDAECHYFNGVTMQSYLNGDAGF